MWVATELYATVQWGTVLWDDNVGSYLTVCNITPMYIENLGSFISHRVLTSVGSALSVGSTKSQAH